MLSWERQRDLYNHLAYLKEKERADNFSWDDWRKRVRTMYESKELCLTISVIVLEIHEPQKITSHRFVQENG